MRLAATLLAAAVAAPVAAPVAALAADTPPPTTEAWPGYQVILWHHAAAALAAARRDGVTAAMLLGQRDDAVDGAALRQAAAPLAAAGLGLYVENIATDFYAPYHRWQPGHAVTWQFDAVRARHAADPADPTVFWRHPSLSDPLWQARIDARLAAHVRALAGMHPLYYSLGDETGIADLAAAWDFDRAPAALAAMRTWLRTQYPTLAALNAEWGSDFADWAAVVPDTTDAALARGDGNYASWSDFKTWMDAAFAAALRRGTQSVHDADPTARAGIEGGQIPGWGGYDYTRLAGAVDVLEAYEAGGNIEIARAVNPALVLLTTSTASGPAEAWRLWHGALLGVRGAILWDPEGGMAGARGAAMAPVFAALRQGGAEQMAVAAPAAGPVAILYAPASQHLRWLLDRRADTRPWTARDAAAEWDDAAARRPLEGALDWLAHRGLAPRWLTPAMLDAGVPAGVRAVLLPQALALSDRSVAALRDFAAAGGRVLADAPPGGFDAHGRPRAAPPLDAVTAILPGFAAATLEAALAAMAPAVTLAHADGTPVSDVEIRPAASGELALLGLLRDPHAATEAAEEVVVTLPRPAWVRDLPGAAPARRLGRIVLHLGAAPAILAIMPTLPPPPILAPVGTGRLRVSLAGPAAAAATVLRSELRDGAGAVLWSGSLTLRGDVVTWTLPPGIAAASARVTELPGGQAAVLGLAGDR